MRKDHDIREAFEKIKNPKILVIGDLMLDKYSWGEVDRISPEAPIPIMRVIREEKRLGGAGNVATNLANLGAKVTVCGVIGKDENGNTIQKLLSTNGKETNKKKTSTHETFTTLVSIENRNLSKAKSSKLKLKKKNF